MEPRTRRRGDRKDGYLVRNQDPMHLIFPYMLPNRADNECVLKKSFDMTEVENYLEKKNAEQPTYPYTLFHVLLAAYAKTIHLRPLMNRFISGKRLYDRNNLSFSFVVKQKFSDKGEESLVIMRVDEDSPQGIAAQMHDYVCREVYQIREAHVEDGSTSMMKLFNRMPGWLMGLALGAVRQLGEHGHMPDAIYRIDPYQSTAFVTNLGSIKMSADYHHLANWGTNSLFVIIGEKHKAPSYDESGNVTMREVVDMGITVDERIADGFYFARSVKLLDAILQHPACLDEPLDAPLPFEWE